MTLEQITRLDPDNPNHQDWDVIVKFIRDRFYNRYFNQIKVLQSHVDAGIRNNCGFLMITVDCIVMETLQQFYEGKDESDNTTNAYLKFFKRNEKFSTVINSQSKAKEFASQVRAGLLHQAKTKKRSFLNKKNSTPIISWIDSQDPKKGIAINRDLFHKEVLSEFETYLRAIKEGNKLIRERCKEKLQTIVVG